MKEKKVLTHKWLMFRLVLIIGISINFTYSKTGNQIMNELNPLLSIKIFLPMAFSPRLRYYAQAFKAGTYYGVWANITTADPVIREPEFSYSSINIVDPNGLWVETGWIKSRATGCVPKFSWAIQPGTAHFIESPRPIVGYTYQYMIYKVTDGNWRLWIIQTDGTVIVEVNIPNSGMNFGDKIQGGGEVSSPSKSNDMGVSNLTALKWRDQYGIWHSWNGWAKFEDNPPYHIDGIAADPNNNVQIYGNNGNPIPPNAPCP